MEIELRVGGCGMNELLEYHGETLDVRWRHLQAIRAARKRRCDGMKATDLEGKLRAAYQHGRMDFLAGMPCHPAIPAAWCGGLTELQIKIIQHSWVDGWLNESQTQERLPA